MADIIGTDLNDSLVGTSERDRIRGLGGDDTLQGESGPDRLLGGDGNDALYAGEGMTGNSANYLDGGNGNDLLAGGRGDDTLIGGAGDDVIWASFVTPRLGVDVIYGGDGNDSIRINGAAATVQGGEGSDRFLVGGGQNLIDGTDQDQWFDTLDYSGVSGRVEVNLAKGTALTLHNGLEAGHDTLLDIEMVIGCDGDDRLIGGNPLNDRMESFQGGSGADTINGGSGRDMLVADATLWGHGVTVNLHLNSATDTSGHQDVVRGIEDLVGTVLDDVLIGSEDDNTFQGLGGADQIDGRGGRDWVVFAGVPGGDLVVDLGAGTAVIGATVTTLAHVEFISGTAGGDRITGNGQDNGLYGGLGADRLVGRGGSDNLSGGAGDDTVFGGTGADFFQFQAGDGHDRVSDFEAGVDHLVLHGLGPDTATEVLALAEQVGGATVITFAGGERLTLSDVDIASLSAGDFIL